MFKTHFDAKNSGRIQDNALTLSFLAYADYYIYCDVVTAGHPNQFLGAERIFQLVKVEYPNLISEEIKQKCNELQAFLNLRTGDEILVKHPEIGKSAKAKVTTPTMINVMSYKRHFIRGIDFITEAWQ